jgi:Lrp/AsnC family transcriptional regulator for asnA, asnC and gidA
MKANVDHIDRAILQCLQEDARMHCSEIARRLGKLSSRAVRNRLSRLLKEGQIIIRAAAVPEKLGFVLSADIYLDVEPGRVEQVAETLKEFDETYYVAITTGDTDISASVVAQNIAALQEFITHKLHMIPGVIRTRTYVLTKILKESCDWPFPRNLPSP